MEAAPPQDVRRNLETGATHRAGPRSAAGSVWDLAPAGLTDPDAHSTRRPNVDRLEGLGLSAVMKMMQRFMSQRSSESPGYCWVWSSECCDFAHVARLPV